MNADPEQIGRYRIETVLGRGAMGIVYKAHDPEIDRPVALKLVRTDLLDGVDRADYLLRFRREAQAAARCVHPNIVTVYDFATHEGHPFLTMEFVDGPNLAQARERGTVFEPADAVFVMLQVLSALGAMHALGIVHRDIKPSNILLATDTVVKVTDFGISRVGASELTQHGAVIGTPSYMSPEQCRGEEVDARSDLFSSGSVLYELLCGERPFAGREYSEVTHRLMFEQPPDIRERRADVSPALKAVLDRALAKAPSSRFATASEMSAALNVAMAGDPSATSNTMLNRTIVVPHAAPATARRLAPETLGGGSLSGMFDAAVLSDIERSLARHVGPIARRLVQSAVNRAATVEDLCASLAGNIEQPAPRDAFRASALQHLRRASPAASRVTAVPGLPQDELDRAQAELSRFIGPIARVLVKRSASAATSPADLWRRLSLHIEREEERRVFLSRRPPS